MMFRRSNRAKNGPVPLPSAATRYCRNSPVPTGPARVLESTVQSLQVAILVPTRAFGARELEELVVEYPAARGRVHLTGTAVIEDPHEPDLIRVQGPLTAEVLQERDFVRVSSARPVLVYMGSGSEKIQSFTVDLSGGGLLLAGPDTLQIGERIEFRLTVAQDAPPIKGVGTVVRIDSKGGAESASPRSPRPTGAGSSGSSSTCSAPSAAADSGNRTAMAAEATLEAPTAPQPSAVAAPVPAPEKAEKAEKADKGKGKGKGKEKKGKGSAADAPGAQSAAPTVAAHPRAARSVAKAKGWGGLGGFLLAGYLSLPTHGLAEACLRALVAGTVCYVVAWGGAVFIWRRLIAIELGPRNDRDAGRAHASGRRRAARSG